jgi:hypothetical protein
VDNFDVGDAGGFEAVESSAASSSVASEMTLGCQRRH